MRPELEKLLSLKNEDFVKKVFLLIQKSVLTDEKLLVLTDVYYANKTIKGRNRYTYPIIREVPVYSEVTQEMTHIGGNRRYYDDKFFYDGRAYILCNDWYYPSEGKKNTKDTRTKFLEWIDTLERI